MKSSLFVLLFTLVTATGAFADNLQCSNGIVSTGDHKSKLLNSCGQPEDKSVRNELSGSSEKFTTEQIEEWTYTIDGVIKLVRIVNGNVTTITWVGRK